MATKNVKLYPHPDLAARGGIPVTGEWFTTADAARLVGQGLAVRQAPGRRAPHGCNRPPTTNRPARPAREG